MKASKEIVDKTIALAGKWKGTTVFGGYIRDIVIGQGTLETQLYDLDLHFSRYSNMASFVDFLGIFYIMELLDNTSNKYEESMTRSYMVKCQHTKAHLKIDCCCPVSITEKQEVPISISRMDFDVNCVYTKLEGGIANCVMCVPPLNYFHIAERIKSGRFSCVNTPRMLASGKNIIEKTKSEIGKAIKLVYRAEKMVKRGWNQDGLAAVGQLPPIMPYWHVSQWFKTPEDELVCLPVHTDPVWESRKHIVYETKRCALCHGDFEQGHSVLIPPCGHAVHVACSDYDEEPADTTRMDSGIVGWFAKQMKKVGTDSCGDILGCPTCRVSIFPR